MFRRTAWVAAAIMTVSTLALAGKGFRGIERGQFKCEGKAGPGLSFSGDGDDIDAKEEGGKLVFTTDLRKLKMGMRQSHTREAFEVDKFPEAKLTIEKDKVKIPGDKEEVNGSVKAQLTLHGVTGPVNVKYKVSRTGSDYHIKDASFSFDYTNFKVEKICKVGVCVDKDVTIKLKKKIKIRDE